MNVHTNSNDCRFPCQQCIKDKDKGCDTCGKAFKYQCERGCHIKACENCANPSRNNKDGWIIVSSRRGHRVYICSLNCQKIVSYED